MRSHPVSNAPYHTATKPKYETHTRGASYAPGDAALPVSKRRMSSFCSATMPRSSTICRLSSVWFRASLRLLRSCRRAGAGRNGSPSARCTSYADAATASPSPPYEAVA
jgi:hypothetical protein